VPVVIRHPARGAFAAVVELQVREARRGGCREQRRVGVTFVGEQVFRM